MNDNKQHHGDDTNGQDQAALKVMREQIDRMYAGESDQAPKEQASHQNPYNRTHQENFDWRTYHTAWQQYYQQYYHRYYWQQLHAERQKISADTTIAQQKTIITGQNPEAPQPGAAKLKQEVKEKLRAHSQKIRKSHHFVPIISAVGVGLVFLFLQFNSVAFAQIQSYISPGAISGDSIAVNPSANVNVGADPKLIIPKINVEVPVDYGVNNLSETQIQNSLRDGATHYNLPGANAVPGQKGNTVILGHSSNDIFNEGKYKFVFVLLDRLAVGDTFYLNYQGTRYIYRVSQVKTIDPTDVASLQLGTDTPHATLVTCTPPGTALKRLLIIGDQISPDPSGVTQVQTAQNQNASKNIPGDTEPTILDKIWQFFF